MCWYICKIFCCLLLNNCINDDISDDTSETHQWWKLLQQNITLMCAPTSHALYKLQIISAKMWVLVLEDFCCSCVNLSCLSVNLLVPWFANKIIWKKCFQVIYFCCQIFLVSPDISSWWQFEIWKVFQVYVNVAAPTVVIIFIWHLFCFSVLTKPPQCLKLFWRLPCFLLL